MQILTQWVRAWLRFYVSAQRPVLLRLLFRDPVWEVRIYKACCWAWMSFPLRALCTGSIFLLTLTGFSAPARWEQAWGRLMRSHLGRVEDLPEWALLCFPCEEWTILQGQQNPGKRGAGRLWLPPPSWALRWSVQAAFYLTLWFLCLIDWLLFVPHENAWLSFDLEAGRPRRQASVSHWLFELRKRWGKKNSKLLCQKIVVVSNATSLH